MAGSSLVAWTALLAAIAMFLPGPSIGDFVEQVRTASLNGHNVLPRGGGSGYGTTIVSMEYDRLGQAVLDLEYALSLPNIPGSGIRGIAIHKGNRNQVMQSISLVSTRVLRRMGLGLCRWGRSSMNTVQVVASQLHCKSCL